jgi:hypothetical protein
LAERAFLAAVPFARPAVAGLADAALVPVSAALAVVAAPADVAGFARAVLVPVLLLAVLLLAVLLLAVLLLAVLLLAVLLLTVGWADVALLLVRAMLLAGCEMLCPNIAAPWRASGIAACSAWSASLRWAAISCSARS